MGNRGSQTLNRACNPLTPPQARPSPSWRSCGGTWRTCTTSCRRMAEASAIPPKTPQGRHAGTWRRMGAAIVGGVAAATGGGAPEPCGRRMRGAAAAAAGLAALGGSVQPRVGAAHGVARAPPHGRHVGAGGGTWRTCTTSCRREWLCQDRCLAADRSAACSPSQLWRRRYRWGCAVGGMGCAGKDLYGVMRGYRGRGRRRSDWGDEHGAVCAAGGASAGAAWVVLGWRFSRRGWAGGFGGTWTNLVQAPAWS